MREQSVKAEIDDMQKGNKRNSFSQQKKEAEAVQKFNEQMPKGKKKEAYLQKSQSQRIYIFYYGISPNSQNQKFPIYIKTRNGPAIFVIVITYIFNMKITSLLQIYKSSFEAAITSVTMMRQDSHHC